MAHKVVVAGRFMALAALFMAGAALGSSRANDEKVLYTFEGGSDGSGAVAALIADKNGNLYGTTEIGGSGRGCHDGMYGCGTIFKLAPDGEETLLHVFQGSDGAYPDSNLIPDGKGNFYGTTIGGGANGLGTVYRLGSDGTDTVLYSFQLGSSGWTPLGNLAADGDGNLYGATGDGGNSGCGGDGCGTVFKMAADGSESVLYEFGGGSDGSNPEGGVIRGSDGNLYGTTSMGGGSGCNGAGCGTVFKIDPDGTETVLYAFQGGSDGEDPISNLLLDEASNLYGTAAEGGSCADAPLCGTVVRVAPDGTETTLYTFQAGNDGGNPYAGVIMGAGGNLYGTTIYGGGTHCKGTGCGTVFKLAPDGTETVLYAFRGRYGKNPAASLLLGRHGALYGTTTQGGKDNDGVVFRLSK